MKIINLLPKEKQRELHYEAIYRNLVVFAEISVVSFALVFAGQILTRIYLQQQSDSLSAQIQAVQKQSNKEENAKLKSRIKIVNIQISDFKTLADATPAWFRVLRAFAAQVPSSVTVDSFAADLKQKKIDIHGTSPTRESVIELYNNISQDDREFYNIDYPLENVQRPIDVPFHFTFFIKDSLLKNEASLPQK